MCVSTDCRRNNNKGLLFLIKGAKEQDRKVKGVNKLKKIFIETI